ncbi:MAG: response regulator transcription factor [Tissierellia bacterium]|nr:response regulator transcription factor [Tissierellia bacterium]
MKIIIIDDDKLVLNSLTTIIENENIEVLATATDGSDAKALYQKHLPDMVLMDIRMKNINGIEATESILETFPDAKILLLTTFKDEEYINKAIHLGARGYILKDNFSAIVPSIKAVINGNMVFDSNIISEIGKERKEKIEIPLSERELSVLKLVAEGLNNKEIANKLYLSEGTVRNYISTILDKLDLRDRTQLAIYYLKNS